MDGSTIREWLNHRATTNPETVPVGDVFPKEYGAVWEVPRCTHLGMGRVEGGCSRAQPWVPGGQPFSVRPQVRWR